MPDHPLILRNGESATREVTETMHGDGTYSAVHGPWRKVDDAHPVHAWQPYTDTTAYEVCGTYGCGEERKRS